MHGHMQNCHLHMVLLSDSRWEQLFLTSKLIVVARLRLLCLISTYASDTIIYLFSESQHCFSLTKREGFHLFFLILLCSRNSFNPFPTHKEQ